MGLRMAIKKEYFLICHIHLFYLYQKEGENVTLLASQRQLDPLFELMNTFAVGSLIILDHTAFQQVKVESAAKALPMYHLFGWYLQKKKYLKQFFSNTFSHFFFDQKSLLTATLEQNPILSHLKKELRQKKVAFKIISYPLLIVTMLNKWSMQEFHDLRFSLIVTIDRFSNAILSFFHGQKLLFIRKLTPSPQEPHAQQFKNFILDTLKLMEKKGGGEKISLLFFIEGSFDASLLMDFFSYGTFFFKEDLVLFLKKYTHLSCTWSWDNCLDMAVLSEKKTTYLLKSKEKFDTQSLVEKFFPYKNIVMGASLLLNVSLIGASWHLILEVGSFIAQSKETRKKITHIKNKIHDFPLTLDEIKIIQSIQKKALIQEHQLFNFLDVLSHSLDHQYILKTLSIGGQKVKFSLASIEKEESFDHFLELWHHAVSESQIYHTPDQSSLFLGVETSSPLIHEKIF